MKSFELMRELIPENSVAEMSKFTGLTQSLLYMERRESGKALSATGTRNTIDRLDLFCEWNAHRNPEVIRLLADRYARQYREILEPVDAPNDEQLMREIGRLSRLCGDAIGAIADRRGVRLCEIRIAEAIKTFENVLGMVIAMQEVAERR